MLDTRLRNQKLIGSELRRPRDVVAWLGAVQAQDYAGATWALALRARELTASTIEQAFARGQILRTHLLRPTWHFVAPADLRWMQALTGPRVQRMVRGYGRRLGLDARTFVRARGIIERALEGERHLTRLELAAALTRARIPVDGQRLAMLVMDAELEAAICSGPRRGKQFTYALVEARVAPAPVLARDEALAELARRYFQSHGPATVHDFAWWSGLTVQDARRGAAAMPRHVLSEPPSLDQARDAHFLLSNYDEYLIAYKHRGAVIDPARARNLGVFTSVEYPHHVIADGRVAGSWRRHVTTQSAVVTVRSYARPSARQCEALAAQADRFGRFFGVPCTLESDSVTP